MRAAILENAGKEGRYRVEDCPAPNPRDNEVLIRVAYAGVNRADLLQRQGRYPLPAGTPAIAGMEVSGEIIEYGSKTSGFAPGDKVCALVSEGAFAEKLCAHFEHVLPLPSGMTLEQAAALPEACFTCWISLDWQAKLAEGESLLIHGGTSGIGTLGIQIARLKGARVFTTSGSQEKVQLCRTLGADLSINYHEEDFVAAVKQATGGKGADVIFDMVGGAYFERNLDALAHAGRLAIIAFQKGAKVNANLSAILLKHLQITGSTLRSRPAQEKSKLASELKAAVWPALAQGRIKPVIDRIFPLKEAEKALAHMDQGLNIGKILLKI